MPVEVKSSVVIAYPADLNFHSLDKLASSFNLEIPYLCLGCLFRYRFRETGKQELQQSSITLLKRLILLLMAHRA